MAQNRDSSSQPELPQPDIDRMAGHCGRWLMADGPEADVVISTRIRVARNLAAFPFVLRCEDDSRSELLSVVRSAVIDGVGNGDWFFADISRLDELQQRFLNERQLISRELVEMSGPRAVMFRAGEQVSLMINEEDHLRLQVLHSGFAPGPCWDETNAIDDAVGSRAAFAFDDELGFLTACPTNVGTGVRISVMVHLPALRITREIQKVHQAAQKINLAVRGLYGEGSQALGDFYQISNQITLGVSEADIIDNLSEVVPNIIDYERRVRELLSRDNKAKLDDQVSRARGILTSARSISADEALSLLSSLRLGVNLGIVEGLSAAKVNRLFFESQPAHVRCIEKLDTDDEVECNIARARMLSRELGAD